MSEITLRLCCSAAYDDVVICHLEPGHKGPHRGADWVRRKDGQPDQRYRWNMNPDKEWEETA
jgi:hypothetical protein